MAFQCEALEPLAYVYKNSVHAERKSLPSFMQDSQTEIKLGQSFSTNINPRTTAGPLPLCYIACVYSHDKDTQTLYEYANKVGAFTQTQLAGLAEQLFTQLAYLHANNFYVSILNPSLIMVSGKTNKKFYISNLVPIFL